MVRFTLMGRCGLRFHSRRFERAVAAPASTPTQREARRKLAKQVGKCWGNGSRAGHPAHWRACQGLAPRLASSRQLTAPMRRKITLATLRQFMQELGVAARSPGKVYFAGGATALLLGFRDQTIDVDLKLDPEPKGAFGAIARLKEQLNLNVKLASPDDFIPRVEAWRERSQHIVTCGAVEFFHFDFALQMLAKLERGHAQDLEDAASFLRGGYVMPDQLQKCFAEIEPRLIRYPALDAEAFRKKVEAFLNLHEP